MSLKMIHIGLGIMGLEWCKKAIPPNVKDGLIEVVAAVDINPSRLKYAQKYLGLSSSYCYTDLKKALEENKADFCSVVVTPENHEKVINLSIDYDLHILSEKPIADTLDASKRIVNKVLKSDKKMAITMTHRYDQDKTTLINELSSGKYGKIDYLICNVTADTRKLGSWGDFRHKMKNPLMIEGAVHHFDLLSTIAGSPCNTLYAQTWNPSWGDYNGDSQGLAILKFKNGTRAFYEGASCNAVGLKAWEKEYIRVECEKGTLVLSGRKLECFNYNNKKVRVESMEGQGKIIPLIKQSKWGNAWLIEQFYDLVVNGVTMETKVDENIQSVAMVTAAIKSSQTGQQVFVQDLL